MTTNLQLMANGRKKMIEEIQDKNTKNKPGRSHAKVGDLLSKKLGVASKQFADVIKNKANEIASNKKLRQEVDRQIANAGILSEKFMVASVNVANSIKEKAHDIAASNMVSQEINNRLSGVDTPEFIKQFLHTEWSKLMLKIYQRQGTETNAWLQSVRVIDDMVKLINTRYFISGSDRTAKMEYLLERLKNGMQILQMPIEAQEQLIRQIINYDKYLIDKANQIQAAKAAAKNKNSKGADLSNEPFGNELLADNKPAKTTKPTKDSKSTGAGKRAAAKKTVDSRSSSIKFGTYIPPYEESSNNNDSADAAVNKKKDGTANQSASGRKAKSTSSNSSLPFSDELLADNKDK